MTSPSDHRGDLEPIGASVRRHPIAILAVILFVLAAAVTVAAQQTPADSVSPSVTQSPIASASGTVSPPSAASPSSAPGGTPVAGASPTSPAKPSATPSQQPAAIIDSRRFSYEPGWGPAEVQAFLDTQPGTLKSYTYAAGGQRFTLASALTVQSLLYNVNPKVLLTVLEMQGSLVRDPNPGPNELGWAMGYRQDKYWGLGPQVNWAARELYRSAREAPSSIAARGWGSFAVSRLLSQTVDGATQGWTFDRTSAAFVKTYRELFGEDPRLPLANAPAEVTGPFLRPPYGISNVVVSSAFDHEYPTLSENGSMLTYRGNRDQSSYDGHDGWDYVLAAGTPVLAGAAGRVLYAGWSDDSCAVAAGAVILDHDNGYRTLYWHLSSIAVSTGGRVVAGDIIGKSGNTGCSLGAHLHFGVQFLGKSLDPYGYCVDGAVKADPWAAHPAGTASRWLWTDRASPCAVR